MVKQKYQIFLTLENIYTSVKKCIQSYELYIIFDVYGFLNFTTKISLMFVIEESCHYDQTSSYRDLKKKYDGASFERYKLASQGG